MSGYLPQDLEIGGPETHDLWIPESAEPKSKSSRKPLLGLTGSHPGTAGNLVVPQLGFDQIVMSLKPSSFKAPDGQA